jgi:hypothetical protein
MDNLGIKGCVTPLYGNCKKVTGFQIFLESCDEKQIRSEMLCIGSHLCMDEYIQLYPPIIFENSLNIKSLENHCDSIFNDIREMIYIKLEKKYKKKLFELFINPYITLYGQFFKRKELQRKASDARKYRDKRRQLCIILLADKYTLAELEDAESSAKSQIAHKRTAPAFFHVILLLLPYMSLLVYLSLNTNIFSVFKKEILAAISSVIIALKFKDEAFKMFEHYNMLSVSFEETYLTLIQEAIKKKIHLDKVDKILIA